MRGDVLIGSVDLTTITAYEQFKRFRDIDQDFTSDEIFELISNDEAWQVTSELTLSGELSKFPIDWEAGGYFLIKLSHAKPA